MKARALLLGACFLAAGCSNPLNRVTSDRYAATCVDAEDAGDLATAEQACYRAAVNVDWGNLGPELKSERLYNLARIKRKVGKLDEAEALFRQSLELEEQLSGPTSEKSGRRAAELARAYYVKEQYEQGLPLVERLLPIAEGFSGGERKFVAALFHLYAAELRAMGRNEQAAVFEARRTTHGFSAEDFKQ
jgi:tetratricopeptide (TPR) repeat protein